MGRLFDCIKYLPYLVLHPFDGFYEAKFRQKGSTILATILFFLYGITRIAEVQYTGFVANYSYFTGDASMELFISGVLPVALFFISNYCVGTLMDGNGRFRDIYLVTCYSLFPLILFSVVSIVVSNLVIVEELPILTAFYWIGVLWFIFLLFAGLCVVHEYTAMKNIGALFLSAAAAVIIIFLGILIMTLIDRVTGFFHVIYIEAIKRWGR